MVSLVKNTGTWAEMDAVENGIIPNDLKLAFYKNNIASENYQNFARGYKKKLLVLAA